MGGFPLQDNKDLHPCIYRRRKEATKMVYPVLNISENQSLLLHEYFKNIDAEFEKQAQNLCIAA